MYRIYEQKIQNWIDNSSKALLIYGARQVGKTYIIREMLRRNHISYLEINLLEREDILNVLKQIDDAQQLSERLALYSDIPLSEGKSVIFFDEIQKYPEILTKIKFLVDEGRFRYILSGSNLGVELKGIRSVPVGYVEQWQMYPMNFYEFTLALGITDDQWKHVEKGFESCLPVDNVIHEKMMRAFDYYLVSGGMPAAVTIFLERHNLMDVRNEQQNIINQYKADFIKYESEDKRLKIISVYDAIPSQLRKQDLRFTFTYLNKELKFDRYEESFLWLKDAGVAIPVYQAEDAKIPLEISKASNKFKLFSSDVGLLVSAFGPEAAKKILDGSDRDPINNGALFENFVAQELSAYGVPTYYYKKNRIGEVDFLIENDQGVLPLEVKSGSDYKKHRALDHFMNIEEYRIDDAVVLSRFNVESSGKIRYLPIYMTRFLKKEEDRGEFTIEI